MFRKGGRKKGFNHTRKVERALINNLIDKTIHPKAYRDPRWWLVDGVLHFINEHDLPPEVRLMKFVIYNLPKILKGRG